VARIGQALDKEWNELAGSQAAGEAAHRWGEVEPGLAGLRSADGPAPHARRSGVTSSATLVDRSQRRTPDAGTPPDAPLYIVNGALLGMSGANGLPQPPLRRPAR